MTRKAESAWAAGERGGSASVEAGVLVVVFGLLIAFAIAGGRLVSAEAATDHAARAAARSASLQRVPEAATAAARAAADSSLAQQDLRCKQLDVGVDIGGFAAPLGTRASVTATVRCTVEWDDLGLPTSGTVIVESVAVSPLDQYRERT